MELKKILKVFKKNLLNILILVITLALVFIIVWFGFFVFSNVYGFTLRDVYHGIPFLNTLVSHIRFNLGTRTPLGIFYIFFISSIFFIPSPVEFIYGGLILSTDIFVLAPFTYFGILTGQLFNYFFGMLFGFLVKYFVKDKDILKAKTHIKKWGHVGLFVIHLLPLPFQSINLVAGILRYNFVKWFSIVSIALIVRIIIATLLFSFFL